MKAVDSAIKDMMANMVRDFTGLHPVAINTCRSHRGRDWTHFEIILPREDALQRMTRHTLNLPVQDGLIDIINQDPRTRDIMKTIIYGSIQKAGLNRKEWAKPEKDEYLF